MSQKEDGKETDSSPDASPALCARQHSSSEIVASATQSSPSSESRPFLEIPPTPKQRSSSSSSGSPQKVILRGSHGRQLSVETVITISKDDDKTPETMPKSPHSILSIFGELKQKPLTKSQLIGTLQAIRERKPKAMENFLTYTERLMLMGTDFLSEVLTETSKKISGGDFAKNLEHFLNTDLKRVTNAVIDALHNRAGDIDEQKTKLMVHRNILAMSLLEKILFPERPFRYCQGLVFAGFSLEEKTQLGAMLQKIDSTFDVEDWLQRWQEGRTPFEGIVKFGDDPAADRNQRGCCC